MQEQKISQEGKIITKTQHPDGREDVHISVKMINVDENDEATLRAKKVIEDEIIPNLKASMVRVVVIHRDTAQSASHTVPLPNVRNYAQACVDAFRVAGNNVKDSDFIVVEVHEGSYLTRVTTLEKL